MRVYAIIVAAGKGTRTDKSVPKQYLELGKNKMVLSHSIYEFSRNKNIDKVLVVIADGEENLSLYNEALSSVNSDKILPAIIGGERRQDSVRKAIEFINEYTNGLKEEVKILIHDAARPFVSKRLIDRVVKFLEKHDAVIPAIRIEDTVKKIDKNNIARTINRDNLIRSQTPQGFDLRKIVEKYKKFDDQDITDESQLFEADGESVRLVEGSKRNFKITTRNDYITAKLIVINEEKMSYSKSDVRVGMGFDVHGFSDIASENNFVTLGGIKISHRYKLMGHSDADVLIHAIVDAILGALCLGDIGEHFSDKDPRWKDMDSEIFLQYALELMKEQRYKIVNIDTIIMAEEPKILPHKEEIKENLMAILEIKSDQINIKATTTEKLGFVGRKEGIAAKAVITIRKSLYVK